MINSNTQLKTGPADAGDNRDAYAICGSRGECLRFMPCPRPVATGQSPCRVKLAVA